MSSLLCFDLDSLLHMRPGVNACYGPEGGSDPVDDEELHRCVASTSELEPGGEDWVEVTWGLKIFLKTYIENLLIINLIKNFFKIFDWGNLRW